MAEGSLAQVRSVEGSSAKSKWSSRITSHSSKVSNITKFITTAFVTRAEAEAAQARQSFAEMEANLQNQRAQLAETEQLSKARVTRPRAEIEAELHLLLAKQEAAAVEA